MVSMYTMQGHDEVIIRTKGGPKKRQIKTKPQFEAVRRNNSEWKGCTMLTRMLRTCFNTMSRVEDYPVSGALNAICKQIQKMDTESEHGKRALLLSENKELLSGFSFSKKQVFESIIRVPVEASIDRTTATAIIEIPAINTALNLYNFRKIPYFRIIANLCTNCDIRYIEDRKGYDLSNSYEYLQAEPYESEWMQTAGIHASRRIVLQLDELPQPLPGDVTLLLCIGVEFGNNSINNSIETVKYAGSGKIVKVV